MLLLLLSSAKREIGVEGSREKAVECEACDRPYTYVLTREATGTDKSLFSWSDAAATRKAHANARKNLDRLLDEGVDAAPCPHCGWVQLAMVEAVRRRSYLGLRGVSRVLLLAAGGVAALFVAVLTAHPPGRGPDRGDIVPYLIAAGTVGLIVTLGVLTWGLRSMLNQAYDPNAGHHVRAEPRTEVRDGLAEE